MEALGINAGFLIAQIVNFGVIVLVLGLLLWRPLTKVLDERAETVAKQLEDAEVARKAREEAEATAAKIIEDARREAAAFADEARSRGDEAREGMVADARAEADKIVAEARKDAEEARNQQLAELRNQVAALAMAASHKLIGESLDEAKQRQIVNNLFAQPPDAARNLSGRVEVVSALPLTEAEQQQVKQQTGASDVVFRVDPTILGGVIVRAGGRVIDGSVRESLRDIAARLN